MHKRFMIGCFYCCCSTVLAILFLCTLARMRACECGCSQNVHMRLNIIFEHFWDMRHSMHAFVTSLGCHWCWCFRNIRWWNRSLCPDEYPMKLGVWKRLSQKRVQVRARVNGQVHEEAG